MPRVSICIPSYNSARFLGAAIESSLAQTFVDFELVVSDNASTDETKALCQRYTDPGSSTTASRHYIGRGRLEPLRFPSGRRFHRPPARRRRISARLPGPAARAVQSLLPETGIALGAVELIDEDGRSVGRSWSLGQSGDRRSGTNLLREPLDGLHHQPGISDGAALVLRDGRAIRRGSSMGCRLGHVVANRGHERCLLHASGIKSLSNSRLQRKLRRSRFAVSLRRPRSTSRGTSAAGSPTQFDPRSGMPRESPFAPIPCARCLLRKRIVWAGADLHDPGRRDQPSILASPVDSTDALGSRRRRRSPTSIPGVEAIARPAPRHGGNRDAAVGPLRLDPDEDSDFVRRPGNAAERGNGVPPQAHGGDGEGRPILWHIMKHYARHGLKDFVLCLGYKGHVIKDFFLNYEARMRDVTIHLGGKTSVELHGRHDEDDWTVTLAETEL